VDFHAPIIGDALTIGGGAGYARNSLGPYATRSDTWTAGAAAKWNVSDALTITPYWSISRFKEHNGRPLMFIGDAGVPRFRRKDPVTQPWVKWGMDADNYGTTAVLALGDGWTASAGMFRSRTSFPANLELYLVNLDEDLNGEFSVESAPAVSNVSTSGEARVSKSFNTANVHNTFYASLRGRERRNEFGGTARHSFGQANLLALPVTSDPMLGHGPQSYTTARNLTPAIAYEGVWRNVGQLSLSLQKPSYRRSTFPAGASPVSGRASPWVYNVGAAAYLSAALAVYGSYAKGFEEIGNAPQGAVNRGEAVAAQLTTQIDGGLRYQISPRLQVVAGAFQIEKPYFNLDTANFYRRIGTVRNRGAEFSLAGGLTDRLTVVAGAIYIDPDVDAGGGVHRKASGPVPLLVRANVQYRVPQVEGLTVEMKFESLSRRYANARNTVRLPGVVTVDAGLRYTDRLFDKPVTLRLQGFNLTNVYGLRVPSGSGEIQGFDVRRFELSLAVDF
jgi:iron complex outermembrane recepter protein